MVPITPASQPLACCLLAGCAAVPVNHANYTTHGVQE
jgi:hypothetical protein